MIEGHQYEYTPPHSVPITFYLVALVALIYLIYNLRRLFTIEIGKEELHKTNFISQVYTGLTFGIGQKKVYSKRFTYASIMHFLIGWGFMELVFATTVDFFASQGWFLKYLPEFDTPWFAFLNDTGGLMLTVGLIMAIMRRKYIKPEALPNSSSTSRGNLFGDTGILWFLLLLCLGGFLSEAARLAVDKPITAHFSYVGYAISHMLSDSIWASVEGKIWWFHAITSLLFLALLPATKMFHVIASVTNIYYTNLSKRGQIRPMHVSSILEDPDADIENVSLGANNLSDFSWKQLLDSVSCTECARCTTVCPASRTGKPLSPMKIITDIRHKLYADTLNLNNYDGALVGGLISETELWSCTTCGACMEECPVLIEHVPTITDMRRHLVLSEGKPPEQSNESLEKTLQNGNPWGMPQHERAKWAEDFNLDLPTLADKKEVDVLYWVGCAGSYDPRNQGIARDLVTILKNANIDFAILGKEETCTGDSARRLGEEYLFETLAKQNIETLNKYKFNTVITACPHCFQVISKEYKDFGGDYNVVHHSQYIQELIDHEKIKVSETLDGTVTYHDACYLGRYNDVYEAPRSIIESLLSDKGEIVEMKDNKSGSLCCGAGGGNMWHEISEGDRINIKRFEQAIDTQADTVATACSFCAIMMEDAKNVTGNENTMQTLDIAELVANSLDK